MAIVGRVKPDGTFMCKEIYEIGEDAQVSMEQDGTFTCGEIDEQAFIDKMKIKNNGQVIIKEIIEGFEGV